MQKVLRVIKTPITLILLLVLLGFGAKWGYEQVTKPDPPKAGELCVMTDVGKKLTPDKVTVRVLNGGEKGGRAKTTAFQLRSPGFHVLGYTNSSRKVDSPVVIGYAADSPEVKLVAQFFTGAVTEGDGRTSHVVDVILPTADTFHTDVKGSVEVDGPVCLPKVSSSESAGPVISPTAGATPSK